MKSYRLEATPAGELDVEAGFEWYESEQEVFGFDRSAKTPRINSTHSSLHSFNAQAVDFHFPSFNPPHDLSKIRILVLQLKAL